MHTSIRDCNQNDTNCLNFVFTSHQLYFELASIISDVVNLVVIVIYIVDCITFILFDMVISDRNQ